MLPSTKCRIGVTPKPLYTNWLFFSSMRTYYVTTAIMYPNARPHIGFAYELIIADFLARWHRLANDDVFFLTGTDEHGQKIEDAAKKANKSPKKFVDEMSAVVKELAEKLNCSNDTFIRTTDKKHTKTAQDVFTKVFEKGLIYKGKYEGLYCTGCEAFYTERELEGGLCPNHKKKPKLVKEDSYFFKMSEFQDRLVKYIEKSPEFIQPEFRRKEILNRLKEPLRDLSVSRCSFKWGVQLPQDKDHVMYVWFDALLNYFSGVSYPTRKFFKFWPANCQVVGKDIIWFHAVIWPTMLMAAGFELPKTVLAHGFMTVDGQKMSKSLGNVVDALELADKFPVDSIRYVLMRDIPAGQDGDFSEASLVARHNGDLADSLGNLLQRTLVLVHKKFNGTVPICGDLTGVEKDLNRSIPDTKVLLKQVDNCNWNAAIETIWNYIKLCNKYINDCEPWKLKDDKKRLATILYTLVEHLRIISILVWPLLPENAEMLTRQLGQPLGKLRDVKFKKTTKGFVNKPKILFEKLEFKKQEDPFEKVNLKVGKVLRAEDHPDADKLFVLTLDAGSEKRQIVTGMKPFYEGKELMGKNLVFISNLKPAKFRGVKSEGMVLAAENGKSVKVIESPKSLPGDQVFVEGVTPRTERVKIDDFAKVKLAVKGGRVVYNKKELKTENGKVVVDMPDGSEVR